MADPAMSPLPPLPPTPAAEAETAARTSGQRKVNIIWEITQALIAGMVTVTGMAVILILVLKVDKIDAALTMLNSAVFTVIGFYFGRTNHQKIGGVGKNDEGR